MSMVKLVGCKDWIAYMRDMFKLEVDIIVLECTKLYQESDVMTLCGDKYSFDSAIFSPSEIGVPAERWRK